jgi:predicted alpha/beta hydrolase family esterase
MKYVKIFFYLFISTLIYSGLYAHEETIMKVKTRGKNTLKYLLIKPDNPKASVILFAGGHGALNLFTYGNGKPGMRWGEKNFIVRTRELFADNGLIVALFDSPSDHKKMDPAWRISKEHADDIEAVINSLKQEFDLPTWVVGTSRGTFSVPNAAIRLQSKINGMVLTATITVSSKKYNTKDTHPKGILDMELDKILIPSLIVSHKKDECILTPAADSEKLKGALSNSVNVKVLYYSGGKYPDSKPCQPLSYHGFYGIENEVVRGIAEFIIENSI